MWAWSSVIGSGSKETSKGWAVMSEVLMCVFSVSNLEEGRRYPAVTRAGCRAVAMQSCMMLCVNFLLICLQWKVWSPQQSCCLPYLQMGGFEISWTGSHSLRLSAIEKAQSGSLCRALDLFMPTSGYDVWGDSKLGSKCRCSGAEVCINL